jgi:hypothetical protein
MPSRLPLLTALLTLTILAGSTHSALGKETGRLAAFAARQDLHDEVCICMADGRISPIERANTLQAAKKILTPEEYAGFKQNLDRISMQNPVEEKPVVVAVKKKPHKIAEPTAPKPIEAKHVAVAAKKKPHKPAEVSNFFQTWTKSLTGVFDKKSKKLSKSDEAVATDQKEVVLDQKEMGEVLLSDRVAETSRVR